MDSKIALVCALALAACGGDDAATPADAGPDAPDIDAAPDAPPAAVSVVVRDHFTGVAGVHVAFLSATDAVIANVVTDASGRASAAVPAGGKVVAMSPNHGVGYLWLGVAPGDALALDLRSSNTVENVNVAIPEAVNTLTYIVESKCGSFGSGATSPISIAVYPDCGPTDVAVYRNVSGQIVEGFVLHDQTLTVGAQVNLTQNTYTALVDATTAVTGVPAPWSSVYMSGERALGMEPLYGVYAENFALVNGAATNSGKIAPTAGSQLSFVQLRKPDSIQRQYIYRRAPLTAGAIAVGGLLLPDLGVPTFDGATRTAQWTVSSGGATPTGAVVELKFSAVRWVIASPASDHAIIPALPADFADIDPSPTAALQQSEVRAFAAPGGYNAARPYLLAIQSPRGLLQADGMVVVSDSGSPNQ